MLGTKQDSTVIYDHPSKIFIGVRFVLLGFDPINAQKVRSKLVNGGGVDVFQYGPNCTHVIVDNVIYDDPICVAARTEGKVLVTGLWVDHSHDVCMPVDPTFVIYRPLRDLGGIPGSKSLIVCLTGYQRQDRDDIMTLVGLMGATFSKPLVANKVTHLICYKFEGEKYELAKKMKKIKLVNHRWLEDWHGYDLLFYFLRTAVSFLDITLGLLEYHAIGFFFLSIRVIFKTGIVFIFHCSLRAWEILPEANYDKS